MKENLKEKLILTVENVPVLWDKRHQQHYNRYILKREWKKIACQFGTTDDHIRQVWKNLRQEFGKQLRKTLLTSGSAAPDDLSPSWPYFYCMTFLSDQFAPWKSSGNLTSHLDDNSVQSSGSADYEELRNEDEPNQNSEYDVSNIASEKQASCSHHIQISPNEVIPKAEEAQKGTADILKKTGYLNIVTQRTAIGQQLLELEKEKLKMKRNKVAENTNDEDVGFFNSMLPHVRQLSPPDKLRFRIKVQQLLIDFAYPSQHSISLDQTQYPGSSFSTSPGCPLATKSDE